MAKGYVLSVKTHYVYLFIIYYLILKKIVGDILLFEIPTQNKSRGIF